MVGVALEATLMVLVAHVTYYLKRDGDDNPFQLHEAGNDIYEQMKGAIERAISYLPSSDQDHAQTKALFKQVEGLFTNQLLQHGPSI